MPTINKTIKFRSTLTHLMPNAKTRILAERDSTGVTGIFIDDILVGWFDDLFARGSDCYISVVDRNMADTILKIASHHSDETGQTVVVDSGRNWRLYVK